MLNRWRSWAKKLKTDVSALAVAARDPRVPWYAKALALLVAAYAFSPIDLIPDFIPVVGYLDDLVLLPLGIELTIRMIPEEVWEDCRQQALAREGPARAGRVAAGVIVIFWVAFLAWGVLYFASERA